MPPHVAAQPSPADRLRARWNSMFRRDNNSLYDVLLWQSLQWPCITLQWQPAMWQAPGQLLQQQQAVAEELANDALGTGDDADAEAEAAGMDMDGNHPAAAVADKDDRLAMPLEFQYLLMGDQTSQQEGSHVALYRVALPGPLPAGFDPEQQQLVMMAANMEAVLVIPHGHQDVNKLHSMPSNLNLFATCCDNPQIYLLDLQRQQEYVEQQQQQQQGSPAGSSSSTSSDSESLQQQPGLAAVLGGRAAGGYGLEWNPTVAGLLLAGDVGGGVQLWDVQRGSSGSSSSGCREIQPVKSSPGFADCTINDVSWHAGGSTFAAATVGELLLQDTRAPGLAAAAGSSAAAAAASVSEGLFRGAARAGQVHVRRDRLGQEPAAPDCLSVEFDPNHSYRLASGGRDGYVYILDMRRLNEPLERLALHAGDVRQVSWSKGAPGLLASAGEDSHVLLWDCNKMRHAKKQQRQGQGGHTGAAGSLAAAAATAGNPKAAAATAEAGSSRAAAAGGGAGGGLGLPEPPKTDLSKSIEYLSDQGLLFPHHGHMGSVEQLAWNPDRPWMLASSSMPASAPNGSGEEEEVQGSTVMLWEVNRSYGLLC